MQKQCGLETRFLVFFTRQRIYIEARFARVQFSPMEVLPADQILIQFN